MPPGQDRTLPPPYRRYVSCGHAERFCCYFSLTLCVIHTSIHEFYPIFPIFFIFYPNLLRLYCSTSSQTRTGRLQRDVDIFLSFVSFKRELGILNFSFSRTEQLAELAQRFSGVVKNSTEYESNHALVILGKSNPTNDVYIRNKKTDLRSSN